MKEKKHSDSKPKTESSPSIVQKLLPHIIAIAVFAFITVLYFSPMILDNKEINQSDYIQYEGMSKELSDFRAKTGTEALCVWMRLHRDFLLQRKTKTCSLKKMAAIQPEGKQ